MADTPASDLGFVGISVTQQHDTYEKDPESVIVGGIRSSRATRTELAQMMTRDARLARSGALARPKIVIASNGQIIARYHEDPQFRTLIDRADVVDVDGMPLVIATRLLCDVPLTERVATTDFILDASAAAAREGLRFYFLGAKDGVAAEAAKNLQDAYPGLQVVGTRNGYFTPQDEDALCRSIVESGADVLWLGLGTPLQEQFAFRNQERLKGLGWIRTCGGLFDFYSKRVPRAPLWLQRVGLEWLFRVIQEPHRLGGRYLRTNPTALYHLLTKTHD